MGRTLSARVLTVKKPYPSPRFPRPSLEYFSAHFNGGHDRWLRQLRQPNVPIVVERYSSLSFLGGDRPTRSRVMPSIRRLSTTPTPARPRSAAGPIRFKKEGTCGPA